jgi:cell division protein FtsL
MVKQQQFLLWMMKLPMLGVLTFCLLVCAGTWVWSEYRINQAEERETVAAQKVAEREALIDSLTLEFCKTPAGKKACSTPK